MIVDKKTAESIKDKTSFAPGGWATFDDVSSLTNDMRQRLAINREFKPTSKGPFFVVEMEVTQQVKSNIGFVGAQKEVTAGLLRGGGTQIHFDEAIKGQDRWNFFRPSSSPKLLN